VENFPNYQNNLQELKLNNIYFNEKDTPSATASTSAMGMTYSGDGSSYNFIYEVQLEDGTIVRNLDAESLQKYIDENKGTNYDFANFSTIE
jgi:hypothetical protein